MLGSADKVTREPSQDPGGAGGKATGIVPKSFHTWWNHQSTDWKKNKNKKNRKSNKTIKMPNALFTKKKKKKALTGPF